MAAGAPTRLGAPSVCGCPAGARGGEHIIPLLIATCSANHPVVCCEDVHSTPFFCPGTEAPHSNPSIVIKWAMAHRRARFPAAHREAPYDKHQRRLEQASQPQPDEEPGQPPQQPSHRERVLGVADAPVPLLWDWAGHRMRICCTIWCKSRKMSSFPGNCGESSSPTTNHRWPSPHPHRARCPPPSGTGVSPWHILGRSVTPGAKAAGCEECAAERLSATGCGRNGDGPRPGPTLRVCPRVRVCARKLCSVHLRPGSVLWGIPE